MPATKVKDKKKEDEICANCKKIIRGKVHFIDSPGGSYAKLCDGCFSSINSDIKKQSLGINYTSAILLGIVFGFAASLLWYAVVVITQYQIGFVAIAVGWLVGFGTSLGAGKKRSNRLMLIAILITIIAILFGEYLIMNHYAKQFLSEAGYLVENSFLNPVIILGLVFSSIKTDPLTLLFWGIALWACYAASKPAKLKEVG